MTYPKRKLLYSTVSLLLCVALLVGTTAAWFKQTVNVGGDLQAGELDIDFMKYDGTAYQTVAENANIFDCDGESILWHPGRTEILYLAVKNTESMPAKYQIVVDVDGLPRDVELFRYAIFDGVQGDSAEAAALNGTASLKPTARWAALQAAIGAQTGIVKEGVSLAAPDGYLGVGETDYFALAINMNPEAGNEYQKHHVSVDITIRAVQADGVMAPAGNLGNSVMLNQDFEKNDAGISLHSNGNLAERIQEEDGNWYMHFKSNGSGEMHYTALNLTSLSDYVVMDFDFMMMAEGMMARFYTDAGSNGPTLEIAAINQNGKFYYADQEVALELNTWYNIAIAIDYFQGKVEYYFDGVKTATGDLPEGIDSDHKFARLRMHRTIYASQLGPGPNAAWTDPFELGLDNMRVYDAVAPLDDLGSIKKNIVLTDETLTPDQSHIKAALDGYMTVHTRSGVVSVNGEKDILPTAPVVSGNQTLIQTAELAELLGVTLPAGTADVMDVQDFFTEILNKTVVTDSSVEANSGMVIAGEQAYPLPNGTELQELNDYLFFLNPSDSYILNIFEESGMSGVHPRIGATSADFTRIREAYNSKSDPDICRWVDTLLVTADKYLEQEPAFWELRDGVRLLYVSREVLDKMYALGMAYQITQDMKYADRGFEELQAVCEFQDWNPKHGLDTGEMAAAVGIGYDWLYEAMTPEQRKVVENGIYNLAFYDAIVMYQTGTGYFYNSIPTVAENWGNVVHGGLSVAALSVLEVYPEVASRILQHAFRSSNFYLPSYAPQGGWKEGVGYWDYATSYTVKYFSAMETTLGSTLGLNTCEGLSNTGRYVLDMQADFGTFTYGDCLPGLFYTPEMLYLANKYDDAVLRTVCLEKTDRQFGNGEHCALALLYHDPNAELVDTSNLPLDAVYYGEDQVVTMRDSYTADNTTFFAFHGGDNSYGHAHLDAGSFTFESDGIQWAIELGQDDYNQAGYWEFGETGARWNIFRLRAEAHSTLVINPTKAADQIVNSNSLITRFETKDKGVITVADLTPAYATNATKALRGAFFTDNRRAVVLRDEITLKDASSNVYWFMLTEADIDITSSDDGLTHKAVLTQDGETLTVEFITNQPATLTDSRTAPLVSGTINGNPPTCRRLSLNCQTTSKDLTITVKLTPGTIAVPSEIESYNIPISTWVIPDGVRPEIPKLDKLVIGGEEAEITGYNMVSYYVEGSITEVPEIEAICNNPDVLVTVEKGTLDTKTVITLTDKNDATNVSVYTITYKSVPKPIEFEGKTSIPAVFASASTVPQPQNHPMNLIDAKMDTKWAGDLAGNYVTIDLKTVQSVSGIAILCQGDPGRIYDIVISISQDGNVFTDVWEGQTQPSGEGNGFFEFIDFGVNRDARYVRVTFNGNNQSHWTSIGEIVAYKNN